MQACSAPEELLEKAVAEEDTARVLSVVHDAFGVSEVDSASFLADASSTYALAEAVVAELRMRNTPWFLQQFIGKRAGNLLVRADETDHLAGAHPDLGPPRLAIDASGLIRQVLPTRPPDWDPDRDLVIDGIVIPGFPNLHSHSFQRAMAGMSERRGSESRDTLWTWRQIMFRFLDVLTPEDIEREFRIAGGHWHHGELSLDQFLMLRPVPKSAQYRMPVEGLFLCGAGTHPGGGVMGSAGRNAARAVLAD